MLSDLRLGQYVPLQSAVHRLDPRTKLLGLLVLSTTAFLLDQGMELMGLALIIILLVKLSGVALNWHLSSLKAVWPLLVITLLLNAAAVPGTRLFGLGPVNFTEEGIKVGLLMAARITVIIVATSVFSATTSPIQLTDGLERLFRPLSKLGLPGGELALIMTITLRFIPTIVEEGERLIRAVQARGGELHKKGITKKAQALAPLLIPLLLGAFRRADDLALAMEARGYRTGTARTSYRQLRLRPLDYGVMLISIAVFILLIMTKVAKPGGH